jgi:hypothetical protein
MMVEEWLLAPTPSLSAKSIISVFVIPSSFASSCMRMFFAKPGSAFRWLHRIQHVWPGD